MAHNKILKLTAKAMPAIIMFMVVILVLQIHLGGRTYREGWVVEKEYYEGGFLSDEKLYFNIMTYDGDWTKCKAHNRTWWEELQPGDRVMVVHASFDDEDPYYKELGWYKPGIKDSAWPLMVAAATVYTIVAFGMIVANEEVEYE